RRGARAAPGGPGRWSPPEAAVPRGSARRSRARETPGGARGGGRRRNLPSRAARHVAHGGGRRPEVLDTVVAVRACRPDLLGTLLAAAGDVRRCSGRWFETETAVRRCSARASRWRETSGGARDGGRNRSCRSNALGTRSAPTSAGLVRPVRRFQNETGDIRHAEAFWKPFGASRKRSRPSTGCSHRMARFGLGGEWYGGEPVADGGPRRGGAR